MAETVRITQLDGKLPNIALMRLSAWHKRRGDRVVFSRRAQRDIFEPDYDRVYAGAIFSTTAKKVAVLRKEFPEAVVGGTGSGSTRTIDTITGPHFRSHDYSLYPEYRYSIGFLQRGCRLKCKFCVVPTKEGKPSQYMTVDQVWRGPGHPKKLHLLDNDFFGVPGWRKHIDDIVSGGFKVCLNQGINVRLINDEAAEALARIEFRDDQFTRRRLHTAWDNLKDQKVFFRGIDTLERHGIRPDQVMAYMLVGFDPSETWERILFRFDRMVERGIRPYPMVFDPNRADLKAFQRWAVTGLYRAVPFADYDTRVRTYKRPAEGQAVLL